MAVPTRITLVTLGVADVPASTRFYEALGWRRSSASVEGEVSFFQMGSSALALFRRDALAAETGAAVTDSAGFRAVTLAINLVSRAEVDEVFAAWTAAGATSVAPPAPTSWGGYSSYVADPDGHLWELAHNPSWELGDDGAVVLPA
jgi:uncharacterized protein